MSSARTRRPRVHTLGHPALNKAPSAALGPCHTVMVLSEAELGPGSGAGCHHEGERAVPTGAGPRACMSAGAQDRGWGSWAEAAPPAPPSRHLLWAGAVDGDRRSPSPALWGDEGPVGPTPEQAHAVGQCHLVSRIPFHGVSPGLCEGLCAHTEGTRGPGRWVGPPCPQDHASHPPSGEGSLPGFVLPGARPVHS